MFKLFNKPQPANVWFNKAKALLALGRFNGGLSALDKELAIDPRNKDAWVLKGAVLSDLGRVEEAIGCCDKALSIEPQNSQAWFCKGSWLGPSAGMKKRLNAVKGRYQLIREIRRLCFGRAVGSPGLAGTRTQ